MNSEELMKYIIDNDLIVTILENLGCHSIKGISDIRASLPDDDDNSKISVKIIDDKIKIRVFTKAESIYGNIYNLIMYINQCEFLSAYNWCCNTVGVQSSGKVQTKKDHLEFFKNIKKKRTSYQNNQIYYDLNVLSGYNKLPHIDLIKKDGIISQRVLHKYSVMFDEREDRILFPHFKYDDINKIAGIVGRTVNKAYEELKIPKYMSMLLTEYKKMYNLYGLSHNIKYIKQRGLVIVFEAEKSVIKADMFGYPIGVAVGSHDISDFQQKLLISLDVDICIAFDKDVSEDYILSCCSRFSNYRNVYYIIDAWSLLKEKDSPVDRGHKKWEFLFKHKKLFKESA